MALDPLTGRSYNANIFSIEPGSNKIVYECDSGLFPGSFRNDYVWNIGRTKVYAQTIYGTKFGWIGEVNGTALKPGQSKKIQNFGRSYYVTGLKIHNVTDVRAIVHASKVPPGGYLQFGGSADSIDINYHNLMTELIIFGSKSIPKLSPTLSGVIKTFWPEDKPTVWQEIQEKVNKLADENTQQTINSILDGDIRQYKERIQVLITQMEEKVGDVASNYMNIAKDLVGLENKFSCGKDQPNSQTINYSLLPLYSTLVTLKLTFYCRGIAQEAEIGLSDSNVDTIKDYAFKLIHDHNGAVNYIIELLKDRVNNAYSTAYQEDIYNMMMDTRSYIAVHGLEYVPMWKAMLEDPASDGRAYNDVISYSQFYGSQSPVLYRQAIPEEVPEPLTPKLIGNKRNKLTKVVVHKLIRTPQITGLEVTFEKGRSFMMGEYTGNIEEVDFKGAYLTKLVAKGRGALDQLVFTLSDGREKSIGIDSDQSATFQLGNHHIASIYLSTGVRLLAGQAANIAVSYQRNDTLF